MSDTTTSPLLIAIRATLDVLGAPGVNKARWGAALFTPMQNAAIVSAPRIAMFLGQCAEETGGFSVLEEDLYYSTPGRIQAVWPSRFATVADAEPYACNPEALANRVYAGRGGNGDEASGDGWRYRGRGAIQLTFKDAYAACAASLGQSLNDTFLASCATPEGAAASACWYWSQGTYGGQSLNDLADQGDIESVTRAINGGLTNLDRRQANVTLATNALAPLLVG